MEIILCEKVPNLGELGDKLSVKSGFARNYLLPQKKAVCATKENIEYFEERREEFKQLQQTAQETTEKRKEEIEKLSITITRKASSEGKLFGSVNVADLIKAASDAGLELAKKEVRMPEGRPIRNTGDYEIDIHLDFDLVCVFNLSVVPEATD